MLEGLLSRLLRGTVENLVRSALEEREVDGVPPSYRYRVHGDPTRLHVPDTAIINDALFNVSGGSITVGEYVFFGHHVALLTGTHDFNKFGLDRQTAIVRSGRDIVVEEGAWIASHCVVLGPCVIGAHAVVGAGSLVLKDVEPYTIVAGRPAALVRRIETRPD